MTSTDHFGAYRLVEQLPSAGDGTLYRAHDRFRGRDVALRIFEPAAATPNWRREVWDALRSANDPAWASLHTHGRLNGRTFVDTAWLAQKTLADVLAAGSMKADEAARVLDEIAAALDRAHAVGIVHGCLVPRHVRVATGGAILTDFAVGAAAQDRDDDLIAFARLHMLCTGGSGVVPASRESAKAVVAAMDGAGPAPSPTAAPPRATPLVTGATWWMPDPADPGPPPTPQAPPVPAQRGPLPPVTSSTWWHRGPTGQRGISQTTLTIGRSPSCDVVLNDLLVSLRHAELRREGDTWRIVDGPSWNGTFVNGRRVTDAVIGPHDVIGIGHAMLVLAGDRLEEYRDTGDVRFRADHLVVTAGNRRLLDSISFELEERCLLAVVGPSGAGKSTLLGALTGFRPADTGSIEYDGRDLYGSYDELRQRIGYVPQDDILHAQLTVRTALRYAAQLRFPVETTATEQERRIDEVLAQLGLTGPIGHQRISTLSGGQRKRTSVALELLTRPSLLFLDEPTTGLDPGNAREVLRTLRGLADNGCTVVMVTHEERSLELCDRLLVLAKGGKLAFFGPPDDALRYFGTSDLPDLFLLLDRDETTDFAGRFAASPEAARYAPAASGRSNPRPAPMRPNAIAAASSVPRQQPVGAQFRVLCRRYLSVIAADRFYALFLIALPVVLSLLVRILPGDTGLSVNAQSEAAARLHHVAPGGPQQLLLVLIIAGAFAGFTGAFRELVKERAIYQREAAVGLSRVAYLGSKIAVLGVIAVLQALVIAELGLIGQRGPDNPLLVRGAASVVVAVVAVTVVMTMLGLLVSALIHNENRGMPILVLILMLQLVLCGQLFSVHGQAGLEQASWLVPSRWAYAMGAATAGVTAIGEDQDPLWEQHTWTYVTDLGVLLTLGAAFVAATFQVLKRREQRRPH